jgi:capsular polysaccharide export protein
MSSMDLIIVQLLQVAELAGALGCKTWLLSNSSELHWRKINRQIYGIRMLRMSKEILGNKFSLVKELVKKLEEYSLI